MGKSQGSVRVIKNDPDKATKKSGLWHSGPKELSDSKAVAAGWQPGPLGVQETQVSLGRAAGISRGNPASQNTAGVRAGRNTTHTQITGRQRTRRSGTPRRTRTLCGDEEGWFLRSSRAGARVCCFANSAFPKHAVRGAERWHTLGSPCRRTEPLGAAGDPQERGNFAEAEPQARIQSRAKSSMGHQTAGHQPIAQIC